MKALIVVAALAFALAACTKAEQTSQATTAPGATATEAGPAAQASSEATTPATSKVLKVTLASMKGSTISGTATFTQSESGETRVQINVSGTGSTGQLAGQLRSGTCSQLGQIDLGDTWQLSGGKAEGPTDTTVDRLAAKPMALVIIPVVAQAGSPAVLSCGLTKQ